MDRRLFGAIVISSVCLAAAQTPSRAFPAGALAAKTVAIVNETGNHEVEKGALSALQSWGQFRVIDDPEQADLTFRFVKTRTHEGTSTQKDDGHGRQTDGGFSMSFGSSIRMTASLKGADGDFFSTKTEDSKAKAGTSCINDFHTAFRSARQQQVVSPQSAAP